MRSLIRRPQPAGVPRDPAPSRLRYRYQRLMLTPLFRQTVRVGLPAFALVLAGGIWMGDEANRTALADWAAGLRESVEHRPEFMVRRLDVQGADLALARAISEAMDLEFPVSSFDLDLDALKVAVTDLTAVKSAVVRVRAGGTLRIDVVQREPVAIWRHTDGLRLLDAEGVMTGMIPERSDRADLPLIAGDGARRASAEAMALFAASAPISDRVRGLVRMGERRWDVILEGGQRILLPEDGAVPALERVIALHEAQNLLGLDITTVDLRNPQRVTVRGGMMAVDMIRARHTR